MVDFVGLLKRTIDAQSNATAALRRRIYDRTRETVERQIAGKNLPPDIMALQRRILEKAIDEVENFYQDHDRPGANPASGDAAGIFAALQKNAGIKPPAYQPPRGDVPRPAARGILPDISPYGSYSAGEDEPDAAYDKAGPTAPGRDWGSAAISAGNTKFDAFPPAIAAAAKQSGNAYFARSPAPISAASAGSASHGGYGSIAPAPLAASRKESGHGGGLFSLDDEEDEKERFSPYDGQSGHAASRFHGQDSFGREAYTDNSAFARRPLDEPDPILPDFAETYPPQSYSGGDAYARPDEQNIYNGREPDYRLYDEAGEAQEPRGYRQVPDYSTLSTGFNAYGEPDNARNTGGRDAAAKHAIPPSPYNIIEETISETYDAAPDFSGSGQAQKAGYDKDFSSLNNFLFGDEAYTGEETAAAPPAYAQMPHRQEFQPPAEPVMADLPDDPPLYLEGQESEETLLRDEDSVLPFALSEAQEDMPSADFSPLPDFLLDSQNGEEVGAAMQPDSRKAGLHGFIRADFANDDAFNLEQAFAAGGAPGAFPALAMDDVHAADVLLPEMQKGEAAGHNAADDASKLAVGAGSSIASGIFAQAAIKEKRRSGKRRLLTGGIIIISLLVILGGIFWFLTDFLKNDKHRIAALVNKTPAAEAPKAAAAEKANQRLMPDGQEVDTKLQPKMQDAVQNVINGQTEPIEAAVTGDAIFHEAQTALMPATSAQGTVKWSLLHEKTPEGLNDTVLRGEVSIPGRDIFARITLRPNRDTGIPAVYLTEIMFIVPENFEGAAIDKISPLMFKATEQSTGQELLDMRVYKISNNFFVVTMNMPEQGRNAKLQRNIALMEQLPWMTMNVAYKNGRIGEFNFAKGSGGDALFKQFFDAQPPHLQGAPQDAAPAAPAPKGK